MKKDEIIKELGDLFVCNLNLDFQDRKTILEFGINIYEVSKPTKKMIFDNVIWQEFSQFDFVNIFNSVEIDDNFKTFSEKHNLYFEKMKNYISSDSLEKLKSAKNKFYTFKQTAGFDCFIITKDEIRIEDII